MTVFTASGKSKPTADSMRVERQDSNVITLFRSRRLPDLNRQRHDGVANSLKKIPYGRERMHLDLQMMTYRHIVIGRDGAEIADHSWTQLDGTLPDPAAFVDLHGVADGATSARLEASA